ncbi:MipA/OmpV family protein [Mangrovicoccus ximenensis]|uniref:MipA/OmpV family protein n=1 Tax=Mangrovicoccus ximenensis TaxID=1911570 RepID=UPI00137499D0|nr:MipA/OmpV family protein [Mangrovicoccus ximenensis]
MLDLPSFPDYAILGTGAGPSHIGADETTWAVVPAARKSFGRRYLSLEANYLSANLLGHRHLQAGPAGLLRFGRRDAEDDRGDPLPDIGMSADLGGFLAWETEDGTGRSGFSGLAASVSTPGPDRQPPAKMPGASPMTSTRKIRSCAPFPPDRTAAVRRRPSDSDRWRRDGQRPKAWRADGLPLQRRPHLAPHRLADMDHRLALEQLRRKARHPLDMHRPVLTELPPRPDGAAQAPSRPAGDPAGSATPSFPAGTAKPVSAASGCAACPSATRIPAMPRRGPVLSSMRPISPP